MDDRLTEFRVGLVLVATVFVTGILIMFFGEFSGLVNKQYTLFIRFDYAPGVTVDTPVRKSGVLIGRVTKVELLGDNGVLVTTKMDARYPVNQSDECRIVKSNFVLGDAELEFTPGRRMTATSDVYGDEAYIEGRVAENPMDALNSLAEALNSINSAVDVVVGMESDVRRSLTSIEQAGAEVGGAARTLNSVLVDNQGSLQRILAKSEQAMDRFEFAMASIDEFVSDEGVKQKLEQSLNEVPQLLTDARDFMATMKSVAARADRNLQNIESLTEPLGQAGASLFADVGQSMERIDVLTEELITFSKAINESEGTLGQLIHNRELYDRLNDSAANIEEVSSQLRPILRDARVFTDKVARNPGRIGVQGLLSRQRSGTKY